MLESVVVSAPRLFGGAREMPTAAYTTSPKSDLGLERIKS